MASLNAPNPADVPALLRQGVAAQRERKWAEAERAYRAVLAAAPNHGDAARLLALTYAQTGRQAAAAELLALALVAAPGNAAVLHEIGYGYLLINDPVSALSCLDRAKALAADRADIWFHIGSALLQLDRAAEAAEALDRARMLNPSHVNALLYLARAHLRLGEIDAARDCLSALQALRPDAPLALIFAAQTCTAEDAPALLTRISALLRDVSTASAHPDLFTAAARLLLVSSRREDAVGQIAARNVLGKPSRDHEAFAARIEALKSLDATALRNGDTAGLRSRSLVFVIGLPGSGADLVRLTLLAHPDCAPSAANGTLPQLAATTSNYTAGAELGYPASFAALSDDARRFVAERHLSAQDIAGAPDALRIVDYDRDNYLHAGLIRALFPDARIVLVSRDLEECAHSIEVFGGGYPYGHFGSTDDRLRFLQSGAGLIAHWKRLMPSAIIETDFAHFAAAPTEETARILRACGLSDAPLDATKLSARVSATPGEPWFTGLPPAGAPTDSLSMLSW